MYFLIIAQYPLQQTWISHPLQEYILFVWADNIPRNLQYIPVAALIDRSMQRAKRRNTGSYKDVRSYIWQRFYFYNKKRLNNVIKLRI